ncbi:OmpA family protein [Spiribacter pallidus]|jgi:outer membrane protein OmpA-like peptidoglycan-associated protein|uniref:OmpA family protein n=1 Tax=Spiribacter pallidus TaxID=1987936 RepID=UPI0034A06252
MRNALGLSIGLLLMGLLTGSTLALAESGFHPPWTNEDGVPWRNEDGECWRDPTRTSGPVEACGDSVEPAADPASSTTTDRQQTAQALRSEVLFAFDSADLSESGRAAIDALLAETGDDWRIESLEAIGHTDRIGDPAYNQQLSQARAEAVADALITATGLAPARVTATGRGESQPRVACDGITQRGALIDCLAPNRRTVVEINLLPAD